MAKQQIAEAELRRLLEVGLSDGAIAKELNITRTGVLNRRRAFGLEGNFHAGWPKGRLRKLTVAEYCRLAHLVAQKLCDREMADIIGISVSAVRERRRIANLPSQWVQPRPRDFMPEPRKPSPDERFACAMQTERYEDFRVTAAPRFMKLPPPQQIETGTTLSQGWAAE